MMEFLTDNFRIVFHGRIVSPRKEPVNLLYVKLRRTVYHAEEPSYVHTYFLSQRKNPSPWYTDMRGVEGVSKPHVQKGTPHRLPWGP